ncbi:MAG: hypothetical protein H7A37_06665 [Chlamydiales bacterium]|nr:hypothetical protein [Chlamydiia bacterium]MCP5507965.1 hypothetical protein [Chlamydiales bacterium]
MRVSKRHLTLLELLIALGLTVMVLTTLTYFYRQVDMIDRNIDRIQRESFEMRFIENRLAHVIPTIVSPRNEKKDYFLQSGRDNGDLLFKRGSETLLFTFDNGVDLDKQFSNHVLGRLFVDGEDNLVLAYWPSPKRWEKDEVLPMKKEVLMRGVERIEFLFYVPPERDRSKLLGTQASVSKGLVVEELPRRDAWLPDWKYEYYQLPAMMRVTVKLVEKEEPLRYAFPLANAEEFIIYER